MPQKSQQRQPSQARSRATVEAILEATAQVLRQDGLEGAGTAAIAKRAGVSVGTLYQYFADKDAVYDTLIERLLDARAAQRRDILARQLPDGELGPTIVSVIDALMSLHSQDPRLHQQLLRYEASTGQNRLMRYEEQMRGLVAAQLRAHRDRTRPIEAELGARVLVHAVLGVAERMAREDPEMLARFEIRKEIAALVVGYLAPTNPLA